MAGVAHSFNYKMGGLAAKKIVIVFYKLTTNY
jgi:hypothetical protein